MLSESQQKLDDAKEMLQKGVGKQKRAEEIIEDAEEKFDLIEPSLKKLELLQAQLSEELAMGIL